MALDGPDLWDFKESSTRLVGYAAIKGEKIVELVTAPDRRKAAMELLARACGDAIEQDHRRISLHAPAGSPLLGYFRGESESLPPRPENLFQKQVRAACSRIRKVLNRFRTPSSAWRGCSIRWGCCG